MISNELKQILQEIKDNCQARKMCSGCKFWIDGVCILKDMPEKWELDEIDTEEREYFNQIEPQETETWNGVHAQITAPKGTFERIFNYANDKNDD